MHEEYARSPVLPSADGLGAAVDEPAAAPGVDGLLQAAAATPTARIPAVIKAVQGECRFMAASVPARGSGHITRGMEGGSLVGGIRRRVARR
jgi:hypothetical protein